MTCVITTILSLVTTWGLLYTNRRLFFTGFKKNSKFFLGALLFFLIVIILIFNTHLGYYPSDREWEELLNAKHLNFQASVYGCGYLTILAIFFRIFGAIPEIAVILNLFFASACVFLVLLLAKIIVRNLKNN